MKEKSSKNEKLQPFPTHQTAQGKAPSPGPQPRRSGNREPPIRSAEMKDHGCEEPKPGTSAKI